MNPDPTHTVERGPVVGVGAFVEHAGRVLLIQRGKPPGAGLWAIPGGRQRHGESVAAAAEREVFEETGVRIRAHELVYCFETRFDHAGSHQSRVLFDCHSRESPGQGDASEWSDAVAHHFVIMDLRGEYLSGTPRAGDDARDARWFTPTELAAICDQIQAGTAEFLQSAGLLK